MHIHVHYICGECSEVLHHETAGVCKPRLPPSQRGLFGPCTQKRLRQRDLASNLHVQTNSPHRPPGLTSSACMHSTHAYTLTLPPSLTHSHTHNHTHTTHTRTNKHTHTHFTHTAHTHACTQTDTRTNQHTYTHTYTHDAYARTHIYTHMFAVQNIRKRSTTRRQISARPRLLQSPRASFLSSLRHGTPRRGRWLSASPPNITHILRALSSRYTVRALSLHFPPPPS